MKTLIYTFRTFPYKNEIEKISKNVLILGKIKKDLDRLYEIVYQKKPDPILGIAISKSGNYFEAKTINKFNKNKKVVKRGKEELSLFLPNLKKSKFKINKDTSTSFCNYSTYKIKSYLEDKKIKTPLAFTHLNKEGIKELKILLYSQQHL